VAAVASPSAILCARAGAASAEAAPVPAVALRSEAPEVEVVSERSDAVTLRFVATERSSRGVRSVFVQVPDTGRIETELGQVPGLDAGQLIEVSEPAIMRDLRLVQVVFSPTPSGSQSDQFARELTVTLRATDAPGINEKTRTGRPLSRAFHDLYVSRVINYDAEAAEAALKAQERGGRDPLPYGATYLAISVFGYADEVQPLVDWKHEKGIQSMLVTQVETGTTEAEIRAFIQNAYDTWDVPPEYVLLVGDTEQLPGYESLTYTDNYYSTVEGSDYLSDIFVGRISADYSSHVSTQVAKILGYEKTPLVDDPNWPLTASLWVKDDWDSGDWIYYMNTWRIYDHMEEAGFSPIDTLFAKNDIERSDVYASVNEGKGFINFRGQAWINWLYPFDLNINSINNGWRLPIVVSATCGTGNYESDGFVNENWMRRGSASYPNGSVAFFATNTAFPGSQGLSLRRGYVDEGFFDSVFETGSGTLGEACVAGKMRLYLKDEDQVDYEGWNLLGDPEMQIWTGPMMPLSALHDGGTQIGSSNFSVTVLSEGALYEGARVACVKGDEVLSVGYSDASGQVSLPISPTTTGTMTVTVTDRNAIPYQADVLVLESGPFVVYSDVAVEDLSAGNGDGHLNTGEESDLDVALSNIGNVEAVAVTAHLRCPDTNITVTDSLASYGDMAAGATEWGTDTFTIEVSSGCPNGTLVPYSVVVFIDGVESGVLNPPPLAVVTAEMNHAATLVEDDGAGGDGDGIPDAGETVGMVLTLTNDGLSALDGIEGTLSTTDPRIVITNATVPFGDAAAGGQCDNTGSSFILSISPTATSGHIVPLTLAVTGDGGPYQYSETVEFEITLLGASIAAPLGPDAYGYYAYDRADSAYGPAPDYDWIDIAPPGPGNLITEITDQDAGVVTMGMFANVRYYGENYDLMSINSNGFLAPGAVDYRFGDNSPIPDPHGPPNMIAPFWDDLDPSAGGDIYVWTDLANHILIYQFEEVPIWGTSNTQTFQVIFYDETYYPTPTNDTQIKFQYESVSMPYGCTVGIENLMQDDGIEWLNDATYAPHAAPIEAGAAILFTTIAPSDPDITWLVLTDSSIDDSAGGNGDGLAQIGETIELSVEFSSVGGTSAEDVSVLLSSGESALSVVDSTAAMPNIPAGGSRSNSDPLTFEVTQAVSDSVVTLWAEVTANGGEYTGAGRIDIVIDMSGTGIDDVVGSVFSLRPGRPNPFSADTRLQLTLPSRERVVARVYNPAGRLVKTLVDAPMPAGEHFVPWDGTDEHGRRVASGVYFVRLVAGADRASRKVVLLR
jgi:hypothetical protein